MVRVKFISIYLVVASVIRFATAMEPMDYQVCKQDELIKRTHNIVLARVVGAELIDETTSSVRYKFQTEMVFKGEGKNQFSIEGIPLTSEHYITTFDHHSDALFWKPPVGRCMPWEDAKIRPAFCTGGWFLVFIDEPYHVKSFEHIVATKTDKWLVYVRDKIQEHKNDARSTRGAEGGGGSEESNP